MLGGMQASKLLVTNLIDHAAREHGSREIVTHWADGSLTRTSWGEVGINARKFSQALLKLGIKKGDRIATMAMNHAHHLISWYGSAGAGAVLHTVNPRLFEEQLVYVINHAEDRILLFDQMFTALVEKIKPQLETVEHYIQFDGEKGEYLLFNELLAAQDGDFNWVDVDETDPIGLCYTSGTTGNPKGVLYENRSTVIHAITEVQPDVMNLATRSVMLPVVPMFHANAWGLPFAAAAVGTKLVFSASNEAPVLWRLIREEKVTHSAGVPTVWLSMFADLDANGGDFGKLQMVIIGGSACPRAMIERLMKAGIRVGHAWGMTETSPVGTAGSYPANWDDLNFDQQVDVICLQGRPPFGAELRLVDEAGKELPRDGKTSGELQIRGPWVIKRYFQANEDATGDDNWFDTGDVAVLYPDGTMQITDRAKDVIKSGGEWISSIELENAAIGCPGVAEAAAVGIYHPKWDERPLLLVVRKPSAETSSEDVLAYLEGRVAKWWLPDEVKFVDELPHTPTGKILKRALRDEYKDYKFGNA
jgi:3-(methylthio)propionyl---CoA ligase